MLFYVFINLFVLQLLPCNKLHHLQNILDIINFVITVDLLPTPTSHLTITTINPLRICSLISGS